MNLLTRRTSLLAAVGLLTVAVAAAASHRAGWFQSSSAVDVYDSRSYEIRSDDDASLVPTEDVADLMDRLHAGLPPPDGFTLNGNVGRVKATLTGMVLTTGEEQMVVTIINDADDLVSAQLEIGGAVVSVATLANGSIIERNGMAMATLPGLVSDSTTDIEASWTSIDGLTNSNRVHSP